MNEEETSANELDLDNLPKPELQGHQWLQRGTVLECQSCTFQHGTHIEPGYQLYGINNEGMPMIRNIVKD